MTINGRGKKVPSSNSTQKRLYVFGEKLERGRSPRSNIGDFSLRSTWHNKKSFWEIRRRSFAQDDTSCRLEGSQYYPFDMESVPRFQGDCNFLEQIKRTEHKKQVNIKTLSHIWRTILNGAGKL